MASFFKLVCSQCGKPLKVSQDLAGQTRKCPYCHSAVKIPDAVASPPEAAGEEFPNIVVTPNAASGPAPVPTSGALPAGTAALSQSGAAPSRRRKKSWFHAGSGDSASSDVSLIISGAMGAGMSVVWLAAMLPLRGYQMGQLFWDRGLIPFATTFLMFWSVGILILKWLNLKQQKESMLLDVLPTEVAGEITLDSLNSFVKHINGLPVGGSESFLINRVLRGIEHFRVRKSAAETVTMMESQSAIDANNVAGSYTLLKAFIWALPILGFIGTVVGVSAAVASLASSLDSAADMTAMKGALNSVFAGLGTAFDTTLLALIMSMLVKIPTSALQKSEEDLITSVDEYCNEILLRRLNDGREGGAERGAGGNNGADVKIFREAVEAAMGTHHAELEQWLTKLDAIGGKLTGQVAEGWDKINTRIQKQQLEHSTQLQQQQSEQQKLLQTQLNEMAASATEIQKTLAGVGSQAATMQNDVTGSFAQAQATLQQQFAGLQQGLNSLSSVLQQLGQQQVVVQQVQTPRKRGWFSNAR
ncbi:hypothetical protein GC176_13960 [bacterium]|nr:hypothetical protein [bacterium]